MMINERRKLVSIQEEFNRIFPYLKIEFLAKPAKHPAAHKRHLNLNGYTIGECRTIHKKGSITIIPSMTVADLEQKFSEVYGLTVQVLRKSGKAWLGASLTDSWTLEEQNRQGESLSK